MKTQNKLHRHSPVRKSPRLSSPSSSIQQKPKSRTPTGSDNAWALSLHVIDPQPLEICHPSDEEDDINISTRRFAIDNYRTPIEKCRSRNERPKAKELSALGVSNLRRSPRLSPLCLTLRNGKTVESCGELGSKKKRCRSEDKEAASKGKLGSDRTEMKPLRLTRGEIGNSDLQLLALPGPGSAPMGRGVLSEKSLRSRRVVMPVGNGKSKQKCASKKVSGDLGVNKKYLSSQVTDSALIEFPKVSEKGGSGSSFRRSPRLNNDASETLKLVMIALAEKRSVKENSGLTDKCLRDKNTSVVKQNPKMILDSDVTPEVKRDMENCDGEMTSEKCLRSRKIQLRVNLDEIDEKKSPLIVGNDYKDEQSAEKGIKLVKDVRKQKKIVCCFIGEPISEEEARERWGWRYELKSKKNGQRRKINDDDEDEIILNVDNHYSQARVGSSVLNIGDCVYVKGDGSKKHVGKILEFFKTVDGEDYFRVQWFYRAEDTVLQDSASFHDKRRLFYSTVTNDNLLDCIISKVYIVKIQPAQCLKSNPIGSAAFYYDMEYCVEYTTFRTLVTETSKDGQDSFFSNSRHSGGEPISLTPLALLPDTESSKPELTLLDIYSGCGGMSTGLCFGAKLSGLNLVTKWAVDFDSSACESLKLNHPETQVRNEAAEDFLALLKQWEHLCDKYVTNLERTVNCEFVEVEDITQSDTEDSSGEYEISHLVNICYGDPNRTGKSGLHFLVHWKGYGPDEDTWEPIEGLRNCEERIHDFVRKGFQSKFLPLPGDVGVICGGPPCQGISGYNRYRNFDSPLEDERNRQIVIFMDIVEFLKPKYVLMENVVDIIRFDKASLGRYALSRLVNMKYQARLGIMASGCYGVPQFRLRVFIWGANPSEKLPQFPLPTHDVVVRYWPPPQFERNIVAYDEGQPRTLKEAIILRDSISDLPPVTNNETREEMAYEKDPETEFQTYIRMSKNELIGVFSLGDSQKTKSVLYDHRPKQLSENDYLRTCQIPHQKGANFRNLPGIIVGEDNVARRDPKTEPLTLPTGALLVPDSVLGFDEGKSKRPFARLWWDETVSTVVTVPHVVAQVMLHPEQDRFLTIRECARLQGFPDFYRFCGTITQRYRQVGNAVSVPVARGLGYALGMAYQKAVGDEPLLVLPPNFSSQQPF